MSDKRKQRIRKLQAELGCSYRSACNEYDRRKAAHDANCELGATFTAATEAAKTK